MRKLSSLTGMLAAAFTALLATVRAHIPPGVRYWFRNVPHRVRGWRQELVRVAGIGIDAELSIEVHRADGRIERLGVVSRRMVTDAGVAALADAFMGTFEPENFNFHDSGTGTTAESAAQTALVTPAGPARVSGTGSKPAANQFRTVATISYTGTLAITEHGIFSASTVGTMLDRSVFSAVNVASGDSIQFTYTLTLPSGG